MLIPERRENKLFQFGEFAVCSLGRDTFGNYFEPF